MIQVLHRHQQFSLPAHYDNKENMSHLQYHSHFKHETHINPEESKEKSQLCRRFMEFGFCPYQERCKFAHGSHELLKNKQANMKYKTKECENFRKNHFCIYGKRCNFIHSHDPCQSKEAANREDIQLHLAKRMCHRESRLLSLLE